MKLRGVAKVRDDIAYEHKQMQVRAYERIRPYLAGALGRLRTAYPAFKTVVFRAEKPGDTDNVKNAKFVFVFDDGTRSHEAPKSFDGFHDACEELSRFSDIETFTAGDSLWQCVQGTPQPDVVVSQYRHIESKDWCRWNQHDLNNARLYMRKEIFSRMAYGSHRPGYGKRLVTADGVVVDEWVDPVKALVLRVLQECPMNVDTIIAKMVAITGMSSHSHYYWDVMRACEQMVEHRILWRTRHKSVYDAKFAIVKR